MTHTYTLTGLTCNNCAAKVKSELLKDTDITSAEVTLNPQQAVIEMKRHLSVAQLQRDISRAGHYTISEPASSLIESDTVNWFATYKPILLIFAFLVGIASITSLTSVAVVGNSVEGYAVSFGLSTFMMRFMAGFFLTFSFF